MFTFCNYFLPIYDDKENLIYWVDCRDFLQINLFDKLSLRDHLFYSFVKKNVLSFLLDDKI